MAKLGDEAVDTILAAALSDPDGMLQFANDISPSAEPVMDYITELDTRRALFGELRAFCHRHQTRPKTLNAAILAVFMVAPVTEIRAFFDSLRSLSEFQQRGLVNGTMNVAPEAMRSCTFFYPP